LQLRKPENILWITHGVLCGALLLGGAILVGIVAISNHKNGNQYTSKFRPWESYWIVASAAIILLGTVLFGIGVARSLSKMQLISDFLKRQASKVRLLIIVTFLGILLKVVYNLAISKVINQWRRTSTNTAKPFAAIIFFYFFLTDIVPVAFVLTVFIAPRKSRRTRSGREYSPYSEADVDSSDGLLSNEENY
jgi:heme/copper-type cytochrome/quinol oxidase subunit 2